MGKSFLVHVVGMAKLGRRLRSIMHAVLILLTMRPVDLRARSCRGVYCAVPWMPGNQ